MSKIHAHAALAAKQPLESFSYTPDTLGAFEVEIEISHCGICHTDLHLVDNDWGDSVYPLVPGHEIIGTVKSFGSHADANLLGKRVGVGWQRSSCMACDHCIRGENQLCAQQEPTTVTHYGGFAERILIDSRFAFPIPDAISDAHAAPLLCAGVTVFSPLQRYMQPGMRVGVIGIGGLGHLAIQFAAAMGAEVVAFSSSPAKADEAKQLGAAHVVNSRERDDIKTQRNSLDFILSTVAVNLDWKEYLKVLRPNGTLCFVGGQSEPFSIHPFFLTDAQRSITGSSVGGRDSMRRMLRFAAAHGITPWIETLPFDAVNTALDRLRKNEVRYRFVLEH